MTTRDPIDSISLKRAIADSAAIEVQLEATDGTRPLVAVLHRARRDAAAGLAALIDVEPEDAKEIRRLQNEVKRFRDLVTWLSQIVADGFDADSQVSEEEREELIEMLAGTPEGQQQAIDAGLVEGVSNGTEQG